MHLLESGCGCLVQFDRHGQVTHMNGAARRELGLSGDDTGIGTPWKDVVEPRARRLARRIPCALARSGRWEGEVVLRDVPFHVVAVTHPDAGGRVTRYSALLRNVSSQRHAELQARRQADILSAITEAIPSTVVVVDADGRYRFANRAFERYCGLPRERIIGHLAVDVLGADEIARRRPYMVKAYAGETVEFELDYAGEKGRRWLALTCVPLKVDGIVDGFVGISQDVTRDRHERDRLAHLAESDPLTGLLNRAGFERSMERITSAEGAEATALLYIDLDDFKPVNDRHGHLAGDQLLQLFAQRLLRCVRASDIVARLGGDEFAVVLCGVPARSQVESIAHQVLSLAQEPFVIAGQPLGLTASVGMAFGFDPQAGWREFVGRADAMLYRAKSEGRGRTAA